MPDAQRSIAPGTAVVARCRCRLDARLRPDSAADPRAPGGVLDDVAERDDLGAKRVGSREIPLRSSLVTTPARARAPTPESRLAPAASSPTAPKQSSDRPCQSRRRSGCSRVSKATFARRIASKRTAVAARRVEVVAHPLDKRSPHLGTGLSPSASAACDSLARGRRGRLRQPTAQGVQATERRLRRRPASQPSPRSAPGSATGAPAAGTHGDRLRSKSVDSNSTLPSDFDIFSPPRASTIPWCIQWRAKRLPSATACARSFSWCGKIRSCPPPCRSNPSPSRASDMTTHSVCQPGRPAPQGELHEGSAGFAFFQSAKSSGERFSSFTSTRAPDRSESRLWWTKQPVVADARRR